jgi:hypothetical protein
MTHLRRMMLEVLQRRNYSEVTTGNYLRAVADFAHASQFSIHNAANPAVPFYRPSCSIGRPFLRPVTRFWSAR